MQLPIIIYITVRVPSYSYKMHARFSNVGWSTPTELAAITQQLHDWTHFTGEGDVLLQSWNSKLDGQQIAQKIIAKHNASASGHTVVLQ